MTSPQQSPIIRVRGLAKRYPRQRADASLYARLVGAAWGWTGGLDRWAPLNEGLPVISGVDLDVRAGETLAIVGPSGAGKSTLLHLMGALEPPDDGTILFKGEDVTQMSGRRLAAWRNHTVGYVFQFYHLFPDLDALENVLVPAMVANSVPGYMARRSDLHARARDLLDRVGLADRVHHRPSQLSGGEQQRVAIARALLLEPELLLCDEPTGNLDRRTGEQILELLWKLKDRNKQTYIIVTHDDGLANRADRIVRMLDGKVEGESFPAPVLRDEGGKPGPVGVDVAPTKPPGGEGPPPL